MRILIGYDGSECSDAALDDLVRAGLPDDTEAEVISIAEVWLPPPPADVSVSQYIEDLQTHSQPFKAWQTYAREVSDAEQLAKHAAERLSIKFPQWSISSLGNYGSPTWEIMARARDINADLIVLGSHGRSAAGRFFLGSISQKVLTEAHCSVRVARGPREDHPDTPLRIVVAYDGSPGAKAAVEAVVSRTWPANTELKLIAASYPTPLTDRSMVPASSLSDPLEWLRQLAGVALERLSQSGLMPDLVTAVGNPKHLIVQLAEEWGASCIFMGANRRGNWFERTSLGSVASAVAARAHCSVEVVRGALMRHG